MQRSCSCSCSESQGLLGSDLHFPLFEDSSSHSNYRLGGTAEISSYPLTLTLSFRNEYLHCSCALQRSAHSFDPVRSRFQFLRCPGTNSFRGFHRSFHSTQSGLKPICERNWVASRLRTHSRAGHSTLGLSLLRNRGLAAQDILPDFAGGCFRQLGHKLDSLRTFEVRQ
jgi:hypothetical protein